MMSLPLMFMILLMNASSSIQCCQSVCSLFSVWGYTRSIFAFVHFLHADLAGFHTAEGGEGGALGFPPPESNVLILLLQYNNKAQ